ncbi:MAG: hypothetical protein KY466_14960 [Gemmatimonadetes bacterium]|nr:hypothetical protein [Gemmatimonadota bacterium]
MLPEILRYEAPVDPLDMDATLARQRVGRFDPTGRRAPGAFLKVHIGPGGRPVVWRLTRTDSGIRVEAQGAEPAAMRTFVAQFPPADGADGFRPDHPVLRRLARLRGLRLLRYPWPFDVAAAAVLQQRVRWRVGYSDFRRIALRWGTPTPAGTAFPGAERLAAVAPYRLEAMGIDGKRARALHGLARAQARHGFLQADACRAEVGSRLRRIRGIGPWTVGMILGYAYGEADAVPVGDLHLPTLVTSALAGESEGTDERMLELLEPYRGHRFRVIRLLLWAVRRAPHVLHRYTR